MILSAVVLGTQLLTYNCTMDSLPSDYELRLVKTEACKITDNRKICNVTYELAEVNGNDDLYGSKPNDFWTLKGTETTVLSFDNGVEKKLNLKNKEVTVVLESIVTKKAKDSFEGTFTLPHWPQKMKCEL